jgi:hypothetical protein
VAFVFFSQYSLIVATKRGTATSRQDLIQALNKGMLRLCDRRLEIFCSTFTKVVGYDG